MKNEKQIIEEIDKMYENLINAYEIAGGLRDTFTGIGTNEGKLKEYCNLIRGKIYDINQFKYQFKSTIKI